jgi:hypothetical protein
MTSELGKMVIYTSWRKRLFQSMTQPKQRNEDGIRDHMKIKVKLIKMKMVKVTWFNSTDLTSSTWGLETVITCSIQSLFKHFLFVCFYSTGV